MITKTKKTINRNAKSDPKTPETPVPLISPVVASEKPVETKSTGLESSGPLPMIPIEVIQQLNDQISKKLKAAEIAKKKNEDFTAEIKILEAITSEYLKSFIILGYTLNGHKVLIGHAQTPQDHDALVEHLRQTFMRTIGEM